MMKDALELIDKYYSKKKYKHVCRVASKIIDLGLTDMNYMRNCYIVALCHDLLEDTDCTSEELEKAIGEELASSVFILSKDDNEKYSNYIHSIKASNDEIAILVKWADVSDHLDQLKQSKKDYETALEYLWGENESGFNGA